MPDSTTAEIIQFPARAVAPLTVDSIINPIVDPTQDPAAAPRTRSMAQTILARVSPAEPDTAEARLARALNGLNNAVTAQRAAMAAWRSALSDLKTVTGRLGASLRSYNDSLGHLDARVSTLRGEAVKLEAWADGVLTKKG